MRKGMTLMSVMVAVALSGIVALAVARLLGHQAKSMSIIRLREQREELLKHYKNIVISGWDKTERGGCSGEVCSRTTNESNTDIVIPTANGGALYLSDDLYDYNYIGGTSDKWWKVSVDKSPLTSMKSGKILQADSYVKSEDLAAVSVKVEFIRKAHPVISTKLAPREEIVFLHHNTSSATNRTMCDGAHLTKRDKDGSAFYEGEGGIIQYDFNSNYTKCSQVPLVHAKDCGKGAVLGFFRSTASYTLALDKQRIEGRFICSATDHADVRSEVRDDTEKRTVKAINCTDQGYLEWIDKDEETKCVGTDGAAATGDLQRVAAESRSRVLSRSYNYKLYYISTPGGTRKDRTLPAAPGWPKVVSPAGPALPAVKYTSFSCPVKRYKGIHSFNATGPSGKITKWVDAYDGFGTSRGTAGPRGDPGIPGPDGPTGPASDCFLCCKNKETFTCNCSTTVIATVTNTCSAGGALDPSPPLCSCSVSEYNDTLGKDACENSTSPSFSVSCKSPETVGTYTYSTGCTWTTASDTCDCTVTLDFDSPTPPPPPPPQSLLPNSQRARVEMHTLSA